MSVLKLKLLGQMECATSADSLLALSTRKSEVLLAYLALAPGIRHPRERLINLLWSDRGEEQARNSLRQSLSSIKKSLEQTCPLLLKVERTTVSVNPKLIQVDALEFEQHAASEDIDSLTRAAALHQGEFLEGITIRDAASQEWLATERERFKRQIVEVLSSLSHLQVSTGQHKVAIESAERLVVHDPLHEHGWRILMRAYHEKGDRNHALLSYKRCSDILDRELGIQPESETVELRELIIGGNPRHVNKTTTPVAAPNGPPDIVADPSSETGNKDHSILVLPFDNLSDDPEQQYFSDGLTEGIIMGLSLFPSLKVHSRHSSFAAAEKNWSVKEIGQEFQSLYVVEGSVRKSSDQVRISAQLVNTENGEQIWGKRFDNSFEETFSIEDEVTRAIVAAIKGKIDITDQDIAIRKPAKDMQSYDLLMRGLYHTNRFNPEDNAIGIGLLLECLEKDPDNAIVHNHIYQAYITEFLSGWHDPRSESINNAGFHIRGAMELNPEYALIQAGFAEYSIFTGDWDTGELHTDRALRLNPNDPEVLATAAATYASLGNVNKAIELADACQSLDPFHPWIDWVAGVAYYRGKRYEDALATFKNMPNPADEIDAWLAACYQRLGEHEKASKHLDLYLDIARKNMARFPETLEDWDQLWKASPSYRPEEGIDYPFDALCEAGLKQFVETSSKIDMPSIAVLPFENMSGDPEQEYFSDGITSDIIATLSRFRGIHVVARHSTLIYKERKASLDEIASEQQVRYILEGSIRKSGNRIRVNAELIDTLSGGNCWSESYDRDLDDIFAVQDEITQNITVAMKIHLSHGDRALEHAIGTKNVKAWELCTRAAELEDSYIRDNINQARGLVKSALEIDPNYSFAWTTLGWTHWQAAYLAWTDSIDDSLDEAETAAQKALELAPNSADAWALAGTIQQMRGNLEEAIAACQKAISIAPGNAEAQALLAFALVDAGEFDRALPFHEASLRLAPLCPNWYLLVGGSIYQGKGLLRKAIETFQRAIDVEPESPLARVFLMEALLEAGETDKAKIIAGEIRALDNAFKVSGIIRASHRDGKERDRFQSNLEKMGFKE